MLIEALRTVPVRDVVAVDDGFAACGPDRVDDFAGRPVRASGPVRLGAEVVDDDLGSLPGELQRVSPTDAPARARDDDDSSLTDSHGSGS